MAAYQDRPWVAAYDAHVPPHIDYPEVPVHHLLRAAAEAFPERPACITSLPLPVLGRRSSTLTYAQLDAQSSRVAARLAAFGLAKGDRVALISSNCVQFPVIFFGVLKAGGVVVALNPTFPPPKLAHQLRQSGARFAFVLSNVYAGLNSIRAQTDLQRVIVSNIKDYFPPAGKALFTLAREKQGGHRVTALQARDIWLADVLRQQPASPPQVPISPKVDAALLQFTGGTTGTPKAAAASHYALAANTAQMRQWMGGSPDQQDSFLAAIPFFHVYGMVAVMLFAVSIGAPMIITLDPREIGELLAQIDHFKPTIIMGVPALYNAINRHPDVQAGRCRLDSIRGCVSGSAPLSATAKERFEALTGGRLLEGYGLSEAPTATHCNPLIGLNKPRSIGLPMPGVECRIVSLEDSSTDMPIGEAGELIIRGPNVMLGYHAQPEETALVLRDGWLYTGDIARMDAEGYFYIIDRKKDMISVGGFKVYPSQVEAHLKAHPTVADAAVAGLPHPRDEGEEIVGAWVVLKPGAASTADDLSAYCRAALASYEVPRQISFTQKLPYSELGKLLRRELVRQEAESKGGQLVQPPASQR